MKNKKFLPIFFALALILGLLTPFAALASVGDSPLPSPESYAAVILDRKTGEMLYSRHPDARVFPADTAKLLTALIAVEAIEQGDSSLRAEVTVSENAVYFPNGDGQRMLSAGETISLENLLYCSIVGSADDAANAIAEFLSGSQTAFVAQMNERAERIGCTNTHFSNPSGLYSEDNYTTAEDMAKLAQEATRHDLLTRICSTTGAEIPETNLSAARTLKNGNALITRDGTFGSSYFYNRASGLKAGYNAEAGYCLLTTATDEESGIELIAAIYGGIREENRCSSFGDAIELFDWVFANYSYQEVLSPNKNIASVDVNLGMDTDYVNLRPATAVTLLLPNNYDKNIFTLDMSVYSLEQGKIVTAPVTAGEVLGEVSVMRDGVNYGTVKLVAAANVDLSRSSYITSHIQETIHTRQFRLIVSILAVILVLYLAWVIYYRIRRIRYLRSRKRAKTAPPPRSARRNAAPPPKIEYFEDGHGPEITEEELAAIELPDAAPAAAETAGPSTDGHPAPPAPPVATPAAAPVESQEAAIPEPPEIKLPEHSALELSRELFPEIELPEAEPGAVDAKEITAAEEISAPKQIPTFEDLFPEDAAPGPAAPEPQPEDPFELFHSKAERDYFEEFFRKKS